MYPMFCFVYYYLIIINKKRVTKIIRVHKTLNNKRNYDTLGSIIIKYLIIISYFNIKFNLNNKDILLQIYNSNRYNKSK